jgi:hypothetical protein
VKDSEQMIPRTKKSLDEAMTVLEDLVVSCLVPNFEENGEYSSYNRMAYHQKIRLLRHKSTKTQRNKSRWSKKQRHKRTVIDSKA